MIAHTVYEHDSRVMYYAEELARLGHQVDVICLSEERAAPAPMPGVRVIPIRAAAKKKAVDSPLRYALRLLGFLLRAGWAAAVRGFRQRYDLVHVHSMPDFLVFAALIPKLRGAKVILDVHDLLPEFYASKFGTSTGSPTGRLLALEERLSARFADYVIAANDLWRGRLAARSVPEAKCGAMLNFPDRRIFYPRERQRRSGKTILMYPGTFNRHQGLDIAIRAFGRIQRQVPGAEFHIYGCGPEEENLKKLTMELGLTGRVQFRGARPLREMAELMASADLGVVPKRDDVFGGEAFSTKILEFMAMGVPVIVAGTRIDRSYFDDSVVRFFAAGDEASLASAMMALIQKRSERERLRDNALRFAAAHDWERNRRSYLRIVDRLTGSFHAPSFPHRRASRPRPEAACEPEMCAKL